MLAVHFPLDNLLLLLCLLCEIHSMSAIKLVSLSRSNQKLFFICGFSTLSIAAHCARLFVIYILFLPLPFTAVVCYLM